MTSQDTTARELSEGAAETISSSNWLGRLKARLGFQDTSAIREVLEKALGEELQGSQVFAPQQREMLARIVRFGELNVADVMVPRADIIAIDEQAPISELLQVFHHAGHSRLPLFRDTLDDLRGMVHIKDLISWIVEASAAGAPTPAAAAHGPEEMTVAGLQLERVDLATPIGSTRIRRQVLYVPPSMPALNLLLRMQSTRVHLAMVIDEYGGTDGLVSIEDLVEQIVGEIEDEHDDDDDLMQEDEQGRLVAAARTPVSEIEQRLDVSLLTDPEDAEDFDTLGGLVVAMLGRVPVRGELIHHPAAIEFEILDADPRRIKKVRIYRSVGGTSDSTAEPAGATSG